MDEDKDIVGQLGGFALEQFLGSFTGEQGISSNSLSAIGLGGAAGSASSSRGGAGSQAVDAAQIYSGRYEDEDGDDGVDGEDWEDEVDRELDEEDNQSNQLMLQLPSAAIASRPATQTLMRGEDEDFDDDEEDDDKDTGEHAGNAIAGPSTLNGTSTPVSAFRLPDATEIMHIKEEEQDHDGVLHQEGKQGHEMPQADDHEEEEQIDPQELAAQQALFAQSYARMQAQQQQFQDGTSAQGPASPPLADVKTLYPSFAPDKILNFTEIFHPRPRKRVRIDPNIEVYPFPRPQNYPTQPSTRDFRSHRTYDRSNPLAQFLLDVLREEAANSSDEDGINGVDVSEAAFEQLVEHANAAGWKLPPHVDDEGDRIRFEDWDDEIVWDVTSSKSKGRGQLVNGRSTNQAPEQDIPVPAQHNGTSTETRFGFKNPEIDSGDWLRSIVWSSSAPFKDFTKLQLNLNDPAGPASSLNRPADSAKNAIVRSGTGWSMDPYNLSNDKLYEVRKEAKRTVRQTFGQLEVQHSYPAMKLQFPWYKTQLSKPELRAFHRLAIQFPTNIRLSFSKVRSTKKKKDKTGRKLKKDSVGAEAFRSMGDLSLSQTGNFVLFEFSEENPVIIPNVGMGSIIVNYYRKTDAGDSYVPKEELGEPFLLDPSDESPFMRFGQVEPGQTVPALYNNLVRAPLFKHQPYDTDFVVVKTTINNETKFYVRDFKHLFVVGQTYPLTDVPGPQSRKLTATAKHRLQSIAYKLVSKNPKRRVKINKLLKYFPDQTEMQMRQRLKEFMEYNRAGDDQRFWKIKDGKMPSEDELFKLIRPENVVLAESTQVGQRNLLDAGLSSTVDEDKGKENEASTLDIRQQLAPWFTTKNFLNAAQNKAMLKLHGEGDPSNRGEGFSFLRVSMKDIFLRAGEKLEDRLAEIESRPKSAHRYNVAEQQNIYKTEIDRIWRSQFEALSSPYEPAITEEDDIRWRQEELKMENGPDRALDAFTPADGMSMSPGYSRSASPGALDGQPKGPPKVLRIRRRINGQWTSEIVRDQGVIKGYLRQRQAIEADEEQDPESLVLTGDPEHDAVVKRKLAEHLEKLRKNQERRLQRKNAKKGGTGDVFLPGGKKIKNETTRKCGNCGQIGHMKTNRKCPKWAEFNAANNQQPGANAPSAPANPFAVGLPGLSGVTAGSPS